MKAHAQARRPPLKIITNANASPQHAQIKPVGATVLSHTNSMPRARSTTTSPCVSPASTSSPSAPNVPPPAPTTSSQRTCSPAAANRSRGSKYCSTPQCSSPIASNSSLVRTAEPTTTRPSTAPGSSVSTMDSETYFKLLKKSQVFEHLVQLSSQAGASDQQVRRLQCDQVRAQNVQTRIFAELERCRRQVVDTQQQFLGLLEALTALCLREEQLQSDASDGSNEQGTAAPITAEERTLLDLQRASVPKTSSSASQPGAESTLETRALAAVGHQRIQQLEAICARYEQQLVGSEAALSQAIFSDAARESSAKIAQLEIRNHQLEAENQALEIQLDLAKGQATHLQSQLTQTQEHRTVLAHEKHQLEQELTRHTTATQKFASDLQLELRRRYGVVPSVLELKWQHYFPRLSRPLP